MKPAVLKAGIVSRFSVKAVMAQLVEQSLILLNTKELHFGGFLFLVRIKEMKRKGNKQTSPGEAA